MSTAAGTSETGCRWQCHTALPWAAFRRDHDRSRLFEWSFVVHACPCKPLSIQHSDRAHVTQLAADMLLQKGPRFRGPKSFLSVLIGLGFLPKCRRLPRDEPRGCRRVAWIAPSADRMRIACLKEMHPVRPQHVSWAPLEPCTALALHSAEGRLRCPGQSAEGSDAVFDNPCQTLSCTARFGYVNVTDMKARPGPSGKKSAKL